MELTQAFVDREVRQLLVGDEADLAEAFVQIDTHLRKRFVRGLRDRLRKLLRPEDFADAWQETLRDLLKAVRAREFDPERELCPWLWTIYIRRALDSLLRRDRYEGLLQRLKRRVGGPTSGDILARMDEEERNEILARIRQAVETLPVRQRTVIQTFVDHFPTTEDMDALRQRVSEVTGLVETRTSVKRALQEARRKIGDLLRTRQH